MAMMVGLALLPFFWEEPTGVAEAVWEEPAEEDSVGVVEGRRKMAAAVCERAGGGEGWLSERVEDGRAKGKRSEGRGKSVSFEEGRERGNARARGRRTGSGTGRTEAWSAWF